MAAAIGMAATAAPATAAPGGAPAGASGGASAGDEVVLPAGVRYLPHRNEVVEAGATGFVHNEETTRGAQWTDYRTGETKLLPADYTKPRFDEHSALRAKMVTAADSTHQIVITDVTGGTSATVPLPQGAFWTRAYTADSVVVGRLTDKVVTALSVVRVVDGKTVEQPVEGLPQGMTRVFARQQDSHGAVLGFQGPTTDGDSLHLLQYDTGKLRALPAEFQWPRGLIVLGKDHVLQYLANDKPVTTLRRNDPAAAPVSVTLPAPTGGEQAFTQFAVVGDWIVYRRGLDAATAKYTQGNRLWAVPVTGGAPRELLKYADAGVATAPDGGVLVTGGTGPKDWAVRRITAGQDGEPKLEVVREMKPVTAEINGIALGPDALTYFSDADGNAVTALYERGLLPDGTPQERPLSVRALTLSGGTAPQALGDGLTAYAEGRMLYAPQDTRGGRAVYLPESARLDDAYGRYTLGTAMGRRYLGDFEKGQGDPAPLNNAGGAALWGGTLWRAPNGTNKVEAYDLKAEKVVSAYDIGCNADELQALGRWIYWSCGADKAGVYDRALKKSVAVTGGDVLLGDGFTVRHDHTANKLMLTDFSGGTPRTSEVGEPKAPSPEDRRLSWTVDKFGGRIAYVDAEQRVHIKRVAVPRSPLAVVDSETTRDAFAPADGKGRPWRGSWSLSQPPVSWSVQVKDRAGRLVRTLGKDTRTQGGVFLSSQWDGRDESGKAVVGGQYTWTLLADSGDGTGTREVTRGAVRVHPSQWRDFDGDGFGDLLGVTASGVADFRLGTGRGGVDGKLSGSGWNTRDTTLTAAIPFGDVDGKGCNDVLVRLGSGELRVYRPDCDRPLASVPEAWWSSVGFGWNMFDTLSSPGDLTGDGRPDVLAREARTGDLYLYENSGTKNFKSRVKIGRGWKNYLLASGGGDVNGDGRADLLARDAAGVLWLYPGTGTGTLGDRIKVGGGWQVYNALVVAGDLNGDGRPDLLARDTAGVLWSYAGDGKGNFAGRQRIGGGWQMYKYLF